MTAIDQQTLLTCLGIFCSVASLFIDEAVESVGVAAVGLALCLAAVVMRCV